MSPSEEWVSASCGVWRILHNIKYGGTQFYRRVEPFGWLLCDGHSMPYPKRSTERTLTRYIHRKVRGE